MSSRIGWAYKPSSLTNYSDFHKNWAQTKRKWEGMEQKPASQNFVVMWKISLLSSELGNVLLETVRETDSRIHTRKLLYTSWSQHGNSGYFFSWGKNVFLQKTQVWGPAFQNLWKFVSFLFNWKRKKTNSIAENYVFQILH